MTIDFGFVSPASIGNFVWLDLDMDGVQDANESGIAGVEVTLTPPAGIDVGAGPGNPVTVTTGPNGEYLFSDLPPFADSNPAIGYVVTVNPATLPTDLVQTFDEGATGVIGVLDNSSDPIQLDPNEEHLTADFGYGTAAGVGAIGDKVFVDADDDGVQDPGEPGIAGVSVSLTPAPDVDLGNGLGQPIITQTDQNGNYLFPNLPLNETYIVDVDIATLPAGFTASASGLGDPDVRDGFSSVADNQTTIQLTTQTPVNLDADFGYLPSDAQNNSIGNVIFIDADEDGNGPAGAGDGSDTAEQVVPGVTVSLVDATTGNIIATVITDANGEYLFTGIPDGSYNVVVTDQNNVLAGLDPTVDADGIATPNVSVVDLDSLGDSALPVSNQDQDFGYVEPNSAGGDGVIGDTVFFDIDSSGTPDAGEGIEGVTVELFGAGPDGIIGNADDVLLGSTTTDENGNYLFTGLDTSDGDPANPGSGMDYRVIVDTSSLPNGGSGFTNTVDPDTVGAGDSESVTTLTSSQPSDLDQDFGYTSEDNNSILGTVFPDVNGDGLQQEGGGFSGVTILLLDEDGNTIASTEADADGNYEFTGLPDGIYTIVVTDDNNVLNGFEHTDSPNGLSDTSDQTSKDDTGYTVDLDSAGLIDEPVEDSTGDFGYLPVITNPISLGSFKSTESASGAVLFEWATQTEVANIGFNVYGNIDGDWVVINDSAIIAQGDSVQVQSYSVTIRTEARVFALSDIDLTGKETLHGPYALGQTYGQISERKETDWSSEKSKREANEAQREELRMKQQIERSLERSSAVPQPVSLTPSVLYKDKPSTVNRLVEGMFVSLMSLFVSDAYAVEPESLLNLKTTEAGIHEVKVSDLSSFGVELIGQKSSRLALLNDGTPIPIEVTGGEIISEQSTVRFIAEKVDTLYTGQNVYTLSLNESLAQRISSIESPIPRRAPTATSYLKTVTFAPQTRYSFTSPDSEDAFYAKRMVTIGQPMSESIVMSLDDVAEGGNTGATKAKLNVNVWGGANQVGVSQDHNLRVAFNGVDVAGRRFDGLVEQQIETSLEEVKQGSNVVRLTLPLDTGYAFDAINLNSIKIDYPSKFIALGCLAQRC